MEGMVHTYELLTLQEGIRVTNKRRARKVPLRLSAIGCTFRGDQRLCSEQKTLSLGVHELTACVSGRTSQLQSSSLLERATGLGAVDQNSQLELATGLRFYYLKRAAGLCVLDISVLLER